MKKIMMGTMMLGVLFGIMACSNSNQSLDIKDNESGITYGYEEIDGSKEATASQQELQRPNKDENYQQQRRTQRSFDSKKYVTVEELIFYKQKRKERYQGRYEDQNQTKENYDMRVKKLQSKHRKICALHQEECIIMTETTLPIGPYKKNEGELQFNPGLQYGCANGIYKYTFKDLDKNITQESVPQRYVCNGAMDSRDVFLPGEETTLIISIGQKDNTKEIIDLQKNIMKDIILK